MGRVLAMAFAHPDDDPYAAGSVALHADDPQFRFVLVLATSGEAGEIADGSTATRQTLAAVRQQEDRRAWQVLGRLPDRHEWLGYPDGRLAEAPFGDLVAELVRIFGQERPDVVVTFGPEGITCHPDHLTIGRATTQAFLHLAGDGGPGFRRLLYPAISQGVVARWNRERIARGQEPFDPDTVYHPRGVPRENIDFVVDTSSVAERVRAAMREHRSQWHDLNPGYLTEEQLRRNVSREPYVIAWPQPPPNRHLTDIFQDLS
jgi:LmbE family N-acetylglucosaminyl deacetylase